MIIWKKMGIYSKIILPMIGPFPIKDDVYGYGVAINMVSKLLNDRHYGDSTQYESIRTAMDRTYLFLWNIDGGCIEIRVHCDKYMVVVLQLLVNSC